MRGRACIVACAWVAAAAFLVAGADAGFAINATLKASSLDVAPGGGDSLTGTGFRAGETVTLSLDTTTLATVKTSAKGTFTKTVTIPKQTTSGNHTLHALGGTSGRDPSKVIAVEASWAQFRNGPARWGENALENLLGASNVAGLVPAWHTTGSGFDDRSSPSEAAEVVYQVCKFELCAYNQATGVRIWRSAQANSGDAGDPAIAGSVIVMSEAMCFVSNGDCQRIRGLSKATGTAVWTKLIPSSVDLSPLVIGSTAYYDTDQTMVAIATATGKTIWSKQTTHIPYEAAPAFGSGLLIAPAGGGSEMVALNPSTGAVAWATPTSTFAVTQTPLVAAGSVFGGGEAPSFSGFGAWNATTGAAEWSDINVDPTTPPGYGGNGIVYVGTDNGLVAFDAATGTVLWTADAGQTITAEPAIAGGVVYYGAGTNMIAADATTGMTLWSETATQPIKGSPMIVNGRLFYVTDDGALHADHL